MSQDGQIKVFYLWEIWDFYIPLISVKNSRHYPSCHNKTILPRRSILSGYPHWNVIFVLLYETNPTMVKYRSSCWPYPNTAGWWTSVSQLQLTIDTRGLAVMRPACHLDRQNTVFWQFGHPKFYDRICWRWLFLDQDFANDDFLENSACSGHSYNTNKAVTGLKKQNL